MKMRVVFFLFMMLTTSSILVLRAETPADPAKLLEKMDSILRGKSHDMTVVLDVKTDKWQRNYKIHVLMKGVDYAFARVVEPAKSAGQRFLRVKTRLWNYLPTAERTILIPPSLMLDRFLGSDFSNDDFVKMSYFPRDYESKITGEETMDGFETYHLELLPHPDAPVTYGKLELWLRKTDSAPVRWDFYNDKKERIRTLHYSVFKKFADHETPTVWRMENFTKKGNETVVTILDAAFDIDIPDFVFTREKMETHA